MGKITLHIDEDLLYRANYGPGAQPNSWQIPLLRQTLLCLCLFRPSQNKYSIDYDDFSQMVELPEDTATDVYLYKDSFVYGPSAYQQVHDYVVRYQALLGVNYNKGFPIPLVDDKLRTPDGGRDGMTLIAEALSDDFLQKTFFTWLFPAVKNGSGIQGPDVVELVFNDAMEAVAQRLHNQFNFLFDSKLKVQNFDLGKASSVDGE